MIEKEQNIMSKPSKLSKLTFLMALKDINLQIFTMMGQEDKQTRWQKLVSQHFKITKFQFPLDENMHHFKTFPGSHALDHKLISSTYQSEMLKELPDDASFYHVRIRTGREGRMYEVFCSQWPSYFGQVCRAKYKYLYDEQKKTFNLIGFNNLHTHYPHNVTKQEILDLQKKKQDEKIKEKIAQLEEEGVTRNLRTRSHSKKNYKEIEDRKQNRKRKQKIIDCKSAYWKYVHKE